MRFVTTPRLVAIFMSGPVGIITAILEERFLTLFAMDFGIMATKLEPTMSAIFTRWQSEDRQMEHQAEKLQDWMRDVEPLGIPRFSEMATRLQAFRKLLIQHFDKEDVMLDELRHYYPANSPELAAMHRQASRDHSNLLASLDDFIEHLKQLEPPFTSWQAAMEEIDLFFIQVEQHEEQEADSLRAMMPNK